MAGKKTRKSLDGLRGDIQELAESFAAFRHQFATQQAAAAAERQQRGQNGSVLPETPAPSADGISYVSMFGHYEARPETGEPRDFNWQMERKSIEELLDCPVDAYAQRLAAIGHMQRLSILLMLLDQPSTANEVVAALSLGTTGAAYHHLNVLQAAGFVEQRQRGIFSLVTDQVAVLLIILSALSNTISVDTDSRANDAHDEQDEKAASKTAKGKKSTA